MFVDGRGQVMVEDRDEGPKGRSPDEPLEVRSTGMVIGAVQAGAGDDLFEPAEQGLVADVHPYRDRGLATIAAEAALSDEDADEEPDLELLGADWRLGLSSTCGSCYTVW